jgi:hypothetical protein
MPKTYQRILIHPEAPTKPAQGAPCNGCGVCCLLEPCPLGILLSRRRHGACVAIRWSEPLGQYRCGALSKPRNVLQSLMPWPFLAEMPGLPWALAFAAGRWIAVNQGCDSSVELEQPVGPSTDPQDSGKIEK